MDITFNNFLGNMNKQYYISYAHLVYYNNNNMVALII